MRWSSSRSVPVGRGPVFTVMICCRRWVLLWAPAGKILAPFMPVLVPLLWAEGEITLTDDQARYAGWDLGGHDRPDEIQSPVSGSSTAPG